MLATVLTWFILGVLFLALFLISKWKTLSTFWYTTKQLSLVAIAIMGFPIVAGMGQYGAIVAFVLIIFIVRTIGQAIASFAVLGIIDGQVRESLVRQLLIRVTVPFLGINLILLSGGFIFLQGLPNGEGYGPKDAAAIESKSWATMWATMSPWIWGGLVLAVLLAVVFVWMFIGDIRRKPAPTEDTWVNEQKLKWISLKTDLTESMPEAMAQDLGSLLEKVSDARLKAHEAVTAYPSTEDSESHCVWWDNMIGTAGGVEGFLVEPLDPADRPGMVDLLEKSRFFDAYYPSGRP